VKPIRLQSYPSAAGSGDRHHHENSRFSDFERCVVGSRCVIDRSRWRRRRDRYRTCGQEHPQMVTPYTWAFTRSACRSAPRSPKKTSVNGSGQRFRTCYHSSMHRRSVSGCKFRSYPAKSVGGAHCAGIMAKGGHIREFGSSRQAGTIGSHVRGALQNDGRARAWSHRRLQERVASSDGRDRRLQPFNFCIHVAPGCRSLMSKAWQATRPWRTLHSSAGPILPEHVPEPLRSSVRARLRVRRCGTAFSFRQRNARRRIVSKVHGMDVANQYPDRRRKFALHSLLN
jgi:hypothetical protein